MRLVRHLALVLPTLGLVMLGCNNSAGPSGNGSSEIPATLGASQVLLEVPGMT